MRQYIVIGRRVATCGSLSAAIREAGLRSDRKTYAIYRAEGQTITPINKAGRALKRV